LVFCKLNEKEATVESAYEFLSNYENPRTKNRYGWAIYQWFKLTGHADAEGFVIPKNKMAKLPDILTEEEVLAMAECCDKVRDRAMILLAYESTRRNSEVRNLRIMDVKFDQYGAEVRFRSTKSEDANIRLILSAPSLQTWIEHHKGKRKPEAYVFYGYKDQITEERFKQIVRAAAKKAGIERRVYPHLLRHSRLAKLKREKKLSDDDIMNISGHKDRRMLDRYGRITMAMTNQRLLEIQGLKQQELEKKVTKARSCPRCKFLNSPLSEYCGRCGMVLDEKVAQQLISEKRDLEKLRQHLPRLMEALELLEQKKREEK